MNSWFRIYVATLTRFLTTVITLTVVVHIPRKHLRKVRVDKRTLRGLVGSEYDPSRVSIGRVIHRKPTDLRQNLPSSPVSRQMMKYLFGGDHIIRAVISYFFEPLGRYN